VPDENWQHFASPEFDPDEPEPWGREQPDPAPPPDPELRERTRQQIQALARAFPDVRPGPADWRDSGIAYLVRRDVLLAAEEREDDIREILAPLLAPDADARDGSVVFGVRVLKLRSGQLFDGLRQVEARLGPGLVTPEHFVHTTPNTGGYCQAEEPIPVAMGTSPFPASGADPADGAGVRVVVVDTGYDRSAPHWWLRGVTGDQDPGIGTSLAYEAGHGTFVAGVVRSVAPAADVVVRRVFPHGGTFETDLVRALDRVLALDSPDVISMSAGTNSYDPTGPMCLHRFLERRLPAHKGVALVVAAGNDDRRRFFWPAAHPGTVSVGALGPDQRTRASFSNFGGWVDVFAPGERIVNAFPSGDYLYRLRPKRGQRATFEGMASWSGTSFSTPAVAGLIAARMSRTGENGVTAAAALLKQGRRSAVPGVGAVLR
jgi:subtilisin family serine protease